MRKTILDLLNPIIELCKKLHIQLIILVLGALYYSLFQEESYNYFIPVTFTILCDLYQFLINKKKFNLNTTTPIATGFLIAAVIIQILELFIK